MLLRIAHRTRYAYDAPVASGLDQMRLTPKSRETQSVREWRVDVEGGRIEAEYDDHHANRVTLVGFEPGTESLNVVCEGVVETTDTSGVVGAHRGFAPLWLFLRETALTEAGEGLRALADEVGGGGSDPIGRLHALSAAVAGAIDYRKGETDARTTAEEALAGGAGVCQDHAHAFCAAARLLGHPARYVSGYLHMDGRDEQEATHAWAEAHVDGIGWVGFDVSNGISPDDRYVRIATGLDYGEAAPVFGVRAGAGGESLDVAVQVQQ